VPRRRLVRKRREGRLGERLFFTEALARSTKDVMRAPRGISSPERATCRSPKLPLVAAVLLGLVAGACDDTKKSQPQKPEPAPTARASQAGAPSTLPTDALERADAIAKKLGGAVRQRLTDAMNTGGAAKAAEVCATEAKQIAAKVREETGAEVGRSSLRMRSEADAPPPWVDEWLKEQGERKAEGVEGIRALVKGPAGPVARVLKPIAIEPLCLSCHGDPAAIKDDVKAVLKQRYPGDKATGYQIGDLRGALWAEVPITTGAAPSVPQAPSP